MSTINVAWTNKHDINNTSITLGVQFTVGEGDWTDVTAQGTLGAAKNTFSYQIADPAEDEIVTYRVSLTRGTVTVYSNEATVAVEAPLVAPSDVAATEA